MRLRYTRSASAQLDKALGYVQDRSPQGADNIRERVLSITAMLQLLPYLGHLTSRHGMLRLYIVPYPYFIDYRVTDEEIVIHRFRHTARRPLV